MFKKLIMFFCAPLILSGCISSESDSIISAVGSYGDIAVILSSAKLQNRVTGSVEQLSQEETFVLKTEPDLRFHFFPPDRWKEARNYRTIIILLNWTDGGKVKDLAEGILSEATLLKMKKSGEVALAKNPWFRNQVAILAVANSDNALKQLLSDKKDRIDAEIRNNNTERLIEDFRSRGVYREVKAKYLKHLGFGLEIPMDYKENQVMPDGYNGIEWIISAPPTRGISLAWHDVANIEDAISDYSLLASIRAELGEKLHNERLVEDSFKWAPETVAGIDGVKLSGSWVSEKVGVGGPFWCFFIPDETNNRIICVDLLVYAPDKEKIDYFRKMRASLETFTLKR